MLQICESVLYLMCLLILAIEHPCISMWSVLSIFVCHDKRHSDLTELKGKQCNIKIMRQKYLVIFLNFKKKQGRKIEFSSIF